MSPPLFLVLFILVCTFSVFINKRGFDNKLDFHTDSMEKVITCSSPVSPIGGDIVFSDLSVNISELELSEMNKLRRTKGETL